MMLLCGQSNRIWHYWCGKYPGSVGLLVSPSYYQKVPFDEWMPFVLDNGAFIAWRDGVPWNLEEWRAMLRQVKMSGMNPRWCAVPDVVADKKKTIEQWDNHFEEVEALGWNTALCVQDGMVPEDVPAEADVIFVGGTDQWKFRNLKMWTDCFDRVHCARVNSQRMIERCEELGCESVDGTGWFRDPSRPDKLPMLENFIAGHRARINQMQFVV